MSDQYDPKSDSREKRKYTKRENKLREESDKFLQRPIPKISNLNKSLKEAYDKSFFKDKRFDHLRTLKHIRQGTEKDSITSSVNQDDEDFDIDKIVKNQSSSFRIQRKKRERKTKEQSGTEVLGNSVQTEKENKGLTERSGGKKRGRPKGSSNKKQQTQKPSIKVKLIQEKPKAKSQSDSSSQSDISSEVKSKQAEKQKNSKQQKQKIDATVQEKNKPEIQKMKDEKSDEEQEQGSSVSDEENESEEQESEQQQNQQSQLSSESQQNIEKSKEKQQKQGPKTKILAVSQKNNVQEQAEMIAPARSQKLNIKSSSERSESEALSKNKQQLIKPKIQPTNTQTIRDEQIIKKIDQSIKQNIEKQKKGSANKTKIIEQKIEQSEEQSQQHRLTKLMRKRGRKSKAEIQQIERLKKFLERKNGIVSIQKQHKIDDQYKEQQKNVAKENLLQSKVPEKVMNQNENAIHLKLQRNLISNLNQVLFQRSKQNVRERKIDKQQDIPQVFIQKLNVNTLNKVMSQSPIQSHRQRERVEELQKNIIEKLNKQRSQKLSLNSKIIVESLLFSTPINQAQIYLFKKWSEYYRKYSTQTILTTSQDESEESEPQRIKKVPKQQKVRRYRKIIVTRDESDISQKLEEQLAPRVIKRVRIDNRRQGYQYRPELQHIKKHKRSKDKIKYKIQHRGGFQGKLDYS